MDKYYSYFRVSSKNQEETGVSLDAQREANLEYAKEKEFEIVREYREVMSAAKTGRKEFGKMLEDIRNEDNIRGIIFHDVDRSTRSISDLAKIHELSNEGYRIHYSRDKTDMNDRSSKLNVNVKAVVAADFIENLSQETKKGMYKKYEMGYSSGRAYLGYKCKGGGVRVLNKEVAPLIRQCFELYATGKYTLKDLANVMYKSGLRSESGKKMNFTKISRVLNREYYIGIIKVKGKKFKGNHPPIVSVRLFNKVQEVLQRRYTPKTRVHEYIFKHMLICGNCGKRLRTSTAKQKYQYYRCREKNCLGYIGEWVIEERILEIINQVKFSNDEVKQMIKVAKDLRKSTTLTIDEKIKAIKLQIENTKAKLNKLIDLKLTEDIEPEIFRQKKEELSIELNSLESDLVDCKYSNNDPQKNIEKLGKLLANPSKAYKIANCEQKADLIKSMLGNIRVFSSHLEYEWLTPFFHLHKAKTSNKCSLSPKGVTTGNRTRITCATSMSSSR